MFKIKIDKADREHSTYIRTRDGWKCVRCHRQFQDGDQGLHCSHFYSRGHESTRFDDKNCDSICFGCHAYFHREPEQHRAWKIKQIGQREFDLLTLRTYQYHKKDRKLESLIAKDKLLKLKNATSAPPKE